MFLQTHTHTYAQTSMRCILHLLSLPVPFSASCMSSAISYGRPGHLIQVPTSSTKSRADLSEILGARLYSTTSSAYFSSEDRYLTGEGTGGALLARSSGHSGMPWVLGLLSWTRTRNKLLSSSCRTNRAARPYRIPLESVSPFCGRWTAGTSSEETCWL